MEKCIRRASEQYSLAQYGQRLATIVTESGRKENGTPEPLIPSDFALEFWYRTSLRPGERLPYRNNGESYGMYRALILSFAGRSQNGTKSVLAPEQVLCLAMPLRMTDSCIKIDDPIYPFELVVPDKIKPNVCSVISIMHRQPAIKVAALRPEGPEIGINE